MNNLPPKKRSNIKLGESEFWVKAGGIEYVEAYGRSNHQQASKIRQSRSEMKALPDTLSSRWPCHPTPLNSNPSYIVNDFLIDF